jgi:cell filamentation protein
VRFDTWESYFYPETINPTTREGTLRNLYGERDANVLARIEYVETVKIARTYDGDHLRAIHWHLFQDVYEWAGHYRSVNIAKGPGRNFGDVLTGELERYLRDVRRLSTRGGWGTLGRTEFVERAATVFAYVNQAHPFREGNGRTSKLFMQHVAERSRYTFDYSRVTPEVWNQGSALSGPDLYGYAPEPALLVPVFDAITVERGPGKVRRGR